MFDIGFLELVVVGLVALLVLGPDKLPGAIRTSALWIGRMRRSFNAIKQDIEREVGADEIRRQLRNEEIMEKFRQTRNQVNDTVNSVKKDVDALRKAADLESQTVASALNPNPKPPATPPAPGTAATPVAPPQPPITPPPALEPAATKAGPAAPESSATATLDNPEQGKLL
jgi:sec-independent protein translocase protein TatB